MTAGEPLSGKRVLITRPRGQAASFIDKIEAAGGIVQFTPLIAFRSFIDARENERLRQLSTYDWIILTSKNGVEFFFQHLEEKGVSRADIQARFAAIGTKTAAALGKYGFYAEYIPETFSADQFSKEIEMGSFQAQKVLIPKGNLARGLIANTLRKEGVTADEWIIYETYFPKEEKQCLIDLLQTKSTDVITFTSPSSVRHFMKAAGEADVEVWNQFIWACIGPVTKKEAERFGLRPQICPDVYTSESLAEAIIRYFGKDDTDGITI